MTHEYPPHDFDDSVTRARVYALSHLGFTERQREFLVTVMVHSGCFLERQYCAFTRTVRGQNTREFIARLAGRGFVRVIEPGPVRRGRLARVLCPQQGCFDVGEERLGVHGPGGAIDFSRSRLKYRVTI